MLVNLFVFFAGTMVGSFLNVCISRLPKEESVVLPPSHCPKCNAPIKPWENIPLISYLALGGRCRSCGEKISIRYPLVELLGGLFFLALLRQSNSPQEFFLPALFVSLLIIGFFTDLEGLIIPDEIIVVGLLFGFIFNALNGRAADALLGAATGFAVFFSIAKIAKALARKDALGFGDQKFAAVIGAFLGVIGFWNVFLLAYLLGAAISIFLLAAKIKTIGDYLPFGPFLALGALITLFCGPFVVRLAGF